MKKDNYDYPLDYGWSTQDIIDVIALYNAVEKAYEGGISKVEFMSAYRKFKQVVPSKGEEKKLDKEFEEVSGYSIYRVKKESEKNETIKM